MSVISDFCWSSVDPDIILPGKSRSYPKFTLGHVAELSWQQFTIWMSKPEDLVVGNIMEGGPFYVNKMIEVRLLREENPKHLLFDKELTTCKLRLHTV